MSLETAVKKYEQAFGVKPKLVKKPKHALTSCWDNVCYQVLGDYSLCRQLKCLPKAGGLEDQDWLMMHLFAVIGAAVAECEEKSLGRS